MPKSRAVSACILALATCIAFHSAAKSGEDFFDNPTTIVDHLIPPPSSTPVIPAEGTADIVYPAQPIQLSTFQGLMPPPAPEATGDIVLPAQPSQVQTLRPIVAQPVEAGSPEAAEALARAAAPITIQPDPDATVNEPYVITFIIPMEIPAYAPPPPPGYVPAPAPQPQQTQVQPQPSVQLQTPWQPVAQPQYIGEPYEPPQTDAPRLPEQQLPYQTGRPYQEPYRDMYGNGLVGSPLQAGDFMDTLANPSTGGVSPTLELITPAQVKQALVQGVSLVLVDVRGELVRDVEGHIPGDVSIPFDNQADFPQRVARTLPDTRYPVVIYCRDGTWSAKAGEIMARMGYKVYLMGAYRLWLGR